MDQYAGLLSQTFSWRGRRWERAERKGKGVGRGRVISTVSFLPKPLRIAQWSSGLQKDFGNLGVAHPGYCHPPGTTYMWLSIICAEKQRTDMPLL